MQDDEDMDDPEVAQARSEFAGQDDNELELVDPDPEDESREVGEHPLIAAARRREEEAFAAMGYGAPPTPLDGHFEWSSHTQAMILPDMISAYLQLRAEHEGRPAFTADAFATDWLNTYLGNVGWTGETPAWARAVIQLAGELEVLIPTWAAELHRTAAQPAASSDTDPDSEIPF